MTSTDINVERIYPEHFSLIEDALRDVSSPALLGYHTPAYMNMLTLVLQDNPLYLAARVEDRIAGFMPLRWRTGSLGPVINGLPFFGPNGGPVITSAGRHVEADAVEALARELDLLAHELQAVSVVLYTPFFESSGLLERVFKADRTLERFTQYLRLRPDAPMRWPTRSRRAVMRACKNECSVRIGTPDDVPELLSIYADNCAAADIPVKPDEYFYQIVHTMCPKGIARFTVAEHHDRVIACLITIQCGLTVSYNVPCSRILDRALQGNSLLIDESVQHFQKLGYAYWNWEASASRQHPVYEFKRHWGSVEGTYKILLRYPRGVAPFSGRTARDIADSYPYYFVLPFSDMEQ